MPFDSLINRLSEFHAACVVRAFPSPLLPLLPVHPPPSTDEWMSLSPARVGLAEPLHVFCAPGIAIDHRRSSIVIIDDPHERSRHTRLVSGRSYETPFIVMLLRQLCHSHSQTIRVTCISVHTPFKVISANTSAPAGNFRRTRPSAHNSVIHSSLFLFVCFLF